MVKNALRYLQPFRRGSRVHDKGTNDQQTEQTLAIARPYRRSLK